MESKFQLPVSEFNVIILRGPPGAGKSTFIKNNFPDAFVCSADNFWLNEIKEGQRITSEMIIVKDKSGKLYEYQFDKKRIHEAHRYCMNEFIDSLDNKKPLIVVDNTSIHAWEYGEYVNLALQSNYTVSIISILPETISDLEEIISRCVHRVPREIIVSMCLAFEKGKDDWSFKSSDHSLTKTGKIIDYIL